MPTVRGNSPRISYLPHTYRKAYYRYILVQISVSETINRIKSNKLDKMVDSLRLTKKVDKKGRIIIPKEHRQALQIEGREALVELKVTRLEYLDEIEDKNN